MRVCLIAEKSSLALAVLPVIRELHPDLDPDAFAYAMVNPYTQLNARFRYPRGLRWQDYPFTGKPAYEPFQFGYRDLTGHWTHQVRLSPEYAETFPNRHPDPGLRTSYWIGWASSAPAGDPRPEAEARFRRADVVYAAVDPGDSSGLALDHALAHLALGPATDVRVPLLTSLCMDDMRKAFREPGRPGDARHEARVRRSAISRRFDYGYQVNALAVLRRTLDAAGAARDAEVPSKFGLQTLYLLRARQPITEGRLLGVMQDWRGTGRYPRPDHGGIGGCASRGPILQSLAKAGLTEPEGRFVRVSPLGERFLDLLHPDCEDADLRFRIEAWKGMPEAEAGHRIDRYLRTFFGKQIRFLAKASRAGAAPALTP